MFNSMKAGTLAIAVLAITVSLTTYSQRIDSAMVTGGITGDTSYIIHENIPKSKFRGNSWYVATSYNLCKTNEFDINIGRTYGTEFCFSAGCVYSMRSWGIGYGLTNKTGQTEQLAKAFLEYGVFYFPPFSAGVRADYIHNLTDNSNYIRPSGGLSLFYFDVFYNYSFKLNGSVNDFGHGVTFRVKYFHKKKNWTRSYPRRLHQ